MKTNNMKFVRQIRKANLIITTYVDANGREYSFGRLVKKAKVTVLEREVTNNNVMQMAVNSDVVAPIVEVVNTIEEEAKVIEYMPINKPSDRFDIDDYIAYQEYMIKHGGVPSIEDYFKAIEYYKIASDAGIIEASIELFMYYSTNYLKTRDDVDKELFLKYKLAIEKHSKYSKELRESLEKELEQLADKKEINVDSLLG
jgi:hypothetical protein